MNFKKGDRVIWTRAKTGIHYGTVEEPSDYLVKVLEDYGESYLLPPARLSLSDTPKRVFKEGDIVWYSGGKRLAFKGTFIRAERVEAVLVPENGGTVRVELRCVHYIEAMPTTPYIED